MFLVMSPSCFLGSKLLGKGVPLPFNFLSPSNRPRPSPAQLAHPAGSVHSGTPILRSTHHLPQHLTGEGGAWRRHSIVGRETLDPSVHAQAGSTPGFSTSPQVVLCASSLPPPPPQGPPRQVPPGSSGPKHPPLQLSVGKSLCRAPAAP